MMSQFLHLFGMRPSASSHGPALDDLLGYLHILMALLFIGWLQPEVAGRLRNLRSEGGRLYAQLANGLELRIGAPEQLAEKAQALAAVLSQADPKELAAAAYLDISNPRRPMLGSRTLTIEPPVGATSTDGTSTTGGGTDTTTTPANVDTTGDSTDPTATSG